MEGWVLIVLVFILVVVAGLVGVGIAIGAAGASARRRSPGSPLNTCPRCGAPMQSNHGPCWRCDWPRIRRGQAGAGAGAAGRAGGGDGAGDDLAITERMLQTVYRENRVDAATFMRVTEAIHQRRMGVPASAPAAPPAAAPPVSAARPAAPEPIPLAPVETAALEVDEPLASAAPPIVLPHAPAAGTQPGAATAGELYELQPAEIQPDIIAAALEEAQRNPSAELRVPRRTALPSPAPPPPPAVPRKPLAAMLASFMEERNIRWGELVGGLLIIGCSLALVISFWSQISQLPLLKFLVFTTVPIAFFGAGLYTEHRWRLPNTSRGVLLIAVLLVPLNTLALSAFARSTTTWNLVAFGSQMLALGVFAWAMLAAAARVLAPPPPLVDGVGDRGGFGGPTGDRGEHRKSFIDVAAVAAGKLAGGVPGDTDAAGAEDHGRGRCGAWHECRPKFAEPPPPLRPLLLRCCLLMLTTTR